MSQDPDQIRAEIEDTRARLSSDVDTLADTVNPRNVARRQVGRVGSALSSARDTVMGTAHDAGSGAASSVGSASSSVGSAASSVGGAVQSAPDAARRQARGNPLAAGLVAFGLGALVASLLPATEQEARAAATVKEKVEPLKDEVSDLAKGAAENLKQPAQEAVEQVKQTATEAATTVKQEGTSAAQDVKEDVKPS